MTTKLEILNGLNDYQKEAVINYNGKMSLESTAGSGKTRTLVCRCQYMIKDGVKPSRILVFTFTKKAANELKERISSAIGPDADKMTICTYHSFCGKILRRFPEYTGRTKNFSIYDEDEKKVILRKLQKEFKQAPDKVAVIMSAISKWKSEGTTPQQALAAKPVNSYDRACALIYEAYDKKMQEYNAFDFDDLPYYAFKIVSNNKEVYDYITSCYDYILSDENQDANKQNMDFIMMLGSKNNNIFVVGDTDQSIYSFRGADVDNVINTYKKQDFKINFLPLNYRSTQYIVNASNNVINKNKTRIVKEVKTENDQGSKLKYVKCFDQIQEANYIAYKIKKTMQENPTYKYSDFAVLTRLQAQTSIVEEAMLYAQIPCYVKGHVPFFARSEVKDIIAYIQLAYNLQDKVAFERIVNVPKRGIGKASFEKIVLSNSSLDDIIKDEGVIAKIKLPSKAKCGLLDLANKLNHIREMLNESRSLNEIITYIIDSTSYNKYLEENVVIPGTLAQKKAGLQTLINVSTTFGTDIDKFLSGTILDEDIDIDNENEEIDKKEDGKDKVQVMTIHSSKGLEFENVFIIDCTDNYLPFYMSHKSSVEEERRLFFVAMTRAKKNLFLMYPSRTMRRDGTLDHSVESRFIKEIPTDYMEKIQVRATK